jgi:hypothetical protein
VSDYRTVGDCLDAGIPWDEFPNHVWVDEPEHVEAHGDNLIVDWDEEYER